MIDVHGHLWLGSIEENRRQVLQLCSRYGVEKVFISTLGGQYPTQQQVYLANSETAAFMRLHPGLVQGWVYVNPRLEDACETVQSGLNAGMRGIKLWVDSYCDDPRVWPLAELAMRRGVPLLVHAFYKAQGQWPDESRGSHVAALARRFPGLSIIMAHMGANVYDAVRCVEDCPNVCTDISGSLFGREDLNYTLARLGAGRVLFGSDMPGSFEVCVGQVLGANLDEAGRKRVFEDNARALFRLEVEA